MIAADNAEYLEKDNIVFSIEINGDVRAYPKRILAWHEMFIDTIGGVNIAGVYCTLCGAVIPYKTDVGDGHFELNTSGSLYRSNKLMYDREDRHFVSYDGRSALVDDSIPLPGVSHSRGLRYPVRWHRRR